MIRTLHALVLVALAAMTQQPPSPAPPETIGSRFKNLQVLTDLKDAPAPQLFEMMQFMSGSLSVSCNYCHVSQNGPFESDDNTIKLKAREMIRLVRNINATAFGGKQIVTCNTCHQGSPHPLAVPSPWNKTTDAVAAYKAAIAARKVPSATPAPTKAMPTADEILARYRAAVKADRVTSLRASGENLIAMAGANVRFTAEAQFPERIRLTVDQGGGPVDTIVNGARGWRHTAQGTTDLIPGQVSSTRHTLELVIRPVKYDESVSDRKAAGTASIDGVECYVVESHSGSATERLYFDVATALLKTIRTETATPVGTKVEERWFSDYRPVSGVLIPHLLTSHYMEDQSEFRLTTVEVNPAIDTAAFERPATDPFVGEWRLNPSKSTLLDEMHVESVAGNKYAFDLGVGIIETIAVDGTDQQGLAGTTLSVAVEGNAWKVVRKKDGRILLTAFWKVSDDGHTLTDDYTEFGANGPGTTETFVYKRVGGTSGFAGTWQRRNDALTSAYLLKVTPYETDGLSLAYTAAEVTKNVRLDGKDYPTVGRNAARGSTASARRVSDRALEVTDKIDGKATDAQQLTVSSDLKTLTITIHPVGRRDPNVLIFERSGI